MKIPSPHHARCLSVAAFAMFTCGHFLHAETELFPEGSCEVITSGTGLPDGFVFPDKQDKPWLGGNRAESVEDENGMAVKFFNSETFPFFDKIKASVPLPEGATEITISGRFKAEAVEGQAAADWTGYHVRAVFSETEPSRGEVESPLADEKVANIPPNTPEWTQQSTTLQVPEGAKWVTIQIMVNGLVGTFWFDDISVTSK